MKILAISGSLSATSSNTAIVRAIASLAPDRTEVTIYDGIDDLPHFTPERDTDPAPEAVQRWRTAIQSADGVLFCTPEYAHGMPGSLKNALDWLVSSGDFDGGKPTAALSASPSFLGGDKAHASLVHTLEVLGANIPEQARLTIPLVKKKLAADGTLSDIETTEALRSVLQSLVATISASASR